MFVFFFFFSSRRRHTRLQGAWSSDVCSSDLPFCHVCLGCCAVEFGNPGGLFISPSGISELDYAIFRHDYPLSVEPTSTPRPWHKKKLGEILYLLICSFLPCLSWLLCSRVRESRRDL